MKKAVVAFNTPDIFISELNKKYEIILMPEDSSLPWQTKYHPDMNMAVLGRDIVLPATFENRYPGFIKYLENLSYSLSYTSSCRSEKYPFDSTLNCLIVDRYILCKSVSTDEKLKSIAIENNYEIVDVNQGYSACSSIVCENAVITSDIGIHKTLEKIGIESLFVPYEGIKLNGYNTGFIGGAGGYDDGTLYFFGNVNLLKAADEIRLFAAKHGFETVSLSNGNVFDYGGFKFLK